MAGTRELCERPQHENPLLSEWKVCQPRRHSFQDDRAMFVSGAQWRCECRCEEWQTNFKEPGRILHHHYQQLPNPPGLQELPCSGRPCTSHFEANTQSPLLHEFLIGVGGWTDRSWLIQL